MENKINESNIKKGQLPELTLIPARLNTQLELKDFTFWQAFIKISGSLFALMCAITLGYFYVIGQMVSIDYLSIITNLYLFLITGIMLVQILFFSQNELKLMLESKIRTALGGLVVIVVIVIFMLSLLRFILAV